MKKINNNGRRRRALEEYYKDPNYCLQCGALIKIKDHQRPSEVKKRRFCSRQCRALYDGKNGNIKIENSRRKEALKVYYQNPNRCLNCGQVMEVKSHQHIHDVTRKKFCGSSCANSFNGLQRGSVLIICSRCGNEFERKVKKGGDKLRRSQSKYCEKCQGSRKDNIADKTKEELCRQRSSKYSSRNAIVEDARNVYKNSGKPLKCLLCDFHIVEVCHIKSVSDFSPETSISVINDINNLMPLCPLHHNEWDNNIMDQEDINKIKEIINGRIS